VDGLEFLLSPRSEVGILDNVTLPVWSQYGDTNALITVRVYDIWNAVAVRSVAITLLPPNPLPVVDLDFVTSFSNCSDLRALDTQIYRGAAALASNVRTHPFSISRMKLTIVI